MKKSLVLLFLLVACSTSEKTARSTTELTFAPAAQPGARDQYEATASRVMISSQGRHSTQAGLEVLNKGGNLFDAFTAISFAIGVERPHSTGIGGGGFVLFHSAADRKVQAFDFRETAPRKAYEKMFLDAQGKADARKSLTGGLSVATPGHVAGVVEIQRKYGKLPLKEVLAPAIRIAENGFAVYPALAKALLLEKERLAQFPSSRKIFLDSQGTPWPVGHVLIQKDLAQTLRMIAKDGEKAFYRGKLAVKISRAVKETGGLMDETDLAHYKTKWRTALKGNYRNYEIYSQPPPSSGGTHVLQILNVLEKDSLGRLGPQHPRSLHLTALAMQKAFIDRARYMGDPDFVTVPTDMLISKEYASKIRSRMSDGRVAPAQEAGEEASQETTLEGGQKAESPETTHFSLMDSEGNAIASTQTINGYFGSALVAEGTGIVLNNEMDDFAAQIGASNLFGAIGGKGNLVQANKRPLSSMSPTLVMKDGKPYVALGTPSGTRIITCVAQTLLNVLEYEQPLWEAVTLTRYHQQWMPDELYIEEPMFTPATLAALAARGHKIIKKDLGCRIQIVRREETVLRGVSDPREEGSSAGL